MQGDIRFPLLGRAADLTDQRLRSLRTLTFASLDEKVVTDALRRLDLTVLPVTQAPLHLGEEEDEDTFAQRENLDLIAKMALVAIRRPGQDLVSHSG